MKGQPFHYVQAEPAAAADAPAAGAKPAAAGAAAPAAPAGPIGKAVGCHAGETLGPDGNCYFEGETFAQR